MENVRHKSSARDFESVNLKSFKSFSTVVYGPLVVLEGIAGGP